VTEANKLGIPVVAVVDTDCNPDVIQHLIPGNDDAIRSGHLLCRVVADAVEEGRFILNSRSASKDDGPSLDAEDRAVEQTKARDKAAAESVEREARVASTVAEAGGDEDAGAEVSATEVPVVEEAADEAPVETEESVAVTDVLAESTDEEQA